MNMQAVTIYQGNGQAVIGSTESKEAYAIRSWLSSKAKISGSLKTQEAYHTTILDFRSQLQEQGLDLLDTDIQTIAQIAEAFFCFSKVGRTIAPKTKQQRRATLNSFYAYCMKMTISIVNPIALTENPKGEKIHEAMPYIPEQVQSGIDGIEASTITGLRDYTLLRLALVTGRRVSEISNLVWGDIHREGRQTIVHFLCKGQKPMKDALTSDMIDLLSEYRALLAEELQKRAMKPTESSPVFPSFSNRAYGQALTIQALGQIAKKHLGDSRFHALRHTTAVTLENEGVKVSDISAQLGHSNIKTTSDYLKSKREILPELGGKLENAFKFKPRNK